MWCANEASTAPAAEWISLFNGQDLSGWQTHPNQPGDWRVEEGLLTGSKAISHLFTERGDFHDFHVRAEFRINAEGNSGLFFRSEYGLSRSNGQGPAGYEAQILHRDPPLIGNTTGCIANLRAEVTQSGSLKDTAIKPNEWVTLEVIAQGDHLVVKVDGETTVDVVDKQRTYTQGHFALQVWDAGTVVQFRKIEVRTPAE